MSNGEKTIPEDIVNFFKNKGGHSMIIRGGTGTGKTTFALQLLEELAEPEKSFYLSTRVSDEALFNQFPWLRKEEMKRAIIDSGRILLESLYEKDDKKKIDSDERKKLSRAKDFLKVIGDGEEPKRIDRTRLSILLERNRMPEIEILYDRLERLLPAKPMLVIDSIEGVTHKYGLQADEFIGAIQKDLVENSNTNLLMVVEHSEPSDVEFLVDGVISLTMDEIEARRYRGLHLVKLRATKINQPHHLVTLQGGRFRSFRHQRFDLGEEKQWESIPDNESHYSTGIGALDGILGGGLRKGSYNVIEVGENVSGWEYNLIMRSIIMNFVSQNRGMIAVMTGGEPPEILRSDISRFIGEEAFDKHVRVADYFLTESNKPYVMALGMKKKEEGLRLWMENVSALRGDGKPLLDFTGFDTLEYLRGGEVAIRDLFSGVGRIKISEDLGVGIIRPGLKLTQEIMNMADTYLKIVSLNRYPCIYGIKPKTMVFSIVPDEKRGFPHMDLVPVA
jgi:KaiC/GvpD/RAD55 family RecA-like ATPase